MSMPYKYSAYFGVKSIIRPKSSVGRSNHTDRSLTAYFDENDSTDNSTENNSIEISKSEVVAFFNECSSYRLPSLSPRKEAKSVHFRADIDVIEVECFNNDSGNLWYSEAELLAIERENLKISWQRTNDEELTTGNERQTIRGLELEIYPSAARRRQETEDLAFESVMVEQDNQDRQGIYDPYAIAEAYQKNGAQQCQLEAHTVGLEDFKNIKMDHEEIFKKLIALPKCNNISESACGYHFDESGNIAQ